MRIIDTGGKTTSDGFIFEESSSWGSIDEYYALSKQSLIAMLKLIIGDKAHIEWAKGESVFKFNSSKISDNLKKEVRTAIRVLKSDLVEMPNLTGKKVSEGDQLYYSIFVKCEPIYHEKGPYPRIDIFIDNPFHWDYFGTKISLISEDDFQIKSNSYIEKNIANYLKAGEEINEDEVWDYCYSAKTVEEIHDKLLYIGIGKNIDSVFDFKVEKDDLEELDITEKCDRLANYLVDKYPSFPNLQNECDSVGNEIDYIIQIEDYRECNQVYDDKNKCSISIFCTRTFENDNQFGEEWDYLEDTGEKNENFLVKINRDGTIIDHSGQVDKRLAECKKPITTTETWGYKEEVDADDIASKNVWCKYARNEKELIDLVENMNRTSDYGELAEDMDRICSYIKVLNIPDLTDQYVVKDKIAYPCGYCVDYQFDDQILSIELYWGYLDISLDEQFDYTQEYFWPEPSKMHGMNMFAQFPVPSDDTETWWQRITDWGGDKYCYTKDQLVGKSVDSTLNTLITREHRLGNTSYMDLNTLKVIPVYGHDNYGRPYGMQQGPGGITVDDSGTIKICPRDGDSKWLVTYKKI